MTTQDTLAQWYGAAGPWSASLKTSLLVTAPGGSPGASLAPLALGPVLEALATNDTAFIIDLPGVSSVALGLSFAARGACVVPLFNTTCGQLEFEYVPTGALADALTSAGAQLTPRPQGPPVFLLDAARMQSPANLNVLGYDNRWYVFRSDFPTAERLKQAGIHRLVVVTDRALSDDLQDALVKHAQLERLVVHLGGGAPSPFPPDGLAIVRGIVRIGRELSRNLDGTFGSRVSHG
jgi:hypothetical protein